MARRWFIGLQVFGALGAGFARLYAPPQRTRRERVTCAAAKIMPVFIERVSGPVPAAR